MGNEDKYAQYPERPSDSRVRYFDGQFLGSQDFIDEQRYFLGKLRRHDEYLHGWGTVCGLAVTPHPQPPCRDRWVVVEPGGAAALWTIQGGSHVPTFNRPTWGEQVWSWFAAHPKPQHP